RDDLVTGVQTCALPIYCARKAAAAELPSGVKATTPASKTAAAIAPPAMRHGVRTDLRPARCCGRALRRHSSRSRAAATSAASGRSEEHTSELQSPDHLV